MIVVALTGSIATGKSTVVKWLKELGLAVDDADEHVHRMFKEDEQVISAMRKLWPECVNAEGVNRACLRSKVLGQPDALKTLEAITHPIVRRYTKIFLNERKEAGDKVVFLDIPLLFETAVAQTYDCILVVYCSPEVQLQRALNRGDNPETFKYLLSQQIPLDEKVSRSDFSLNTDGTLAQTHKKLIEVLHMIEEKYDVRITNNTKSHN